MQPSNSSVSSERLEALGREAYGERYNTLRLLSAEEAGAAAVRRGELFESLAGKALPGFAGTKLDCRDLSPGCRACGEGTWSCLFINNRCNCSCFYCPTSQQTTGEPATNSLTFPNPEDYADYVARFGFRGVSISGGEPLLTFDRSLKYLKAVKRRMGDAVYLWLYTNGTLLNADILSRFRDVGLDEIRFDIGATENSLKMLKTAVGVIPAVTVEIPAVPEELDLMKEKIVEMHDAGVRYLNLHQLRLTPYNFDRLAGRGYTFVRGEKVTVLESELAALELLNYSLDRGVDLPINYCSFVFKNRFQRRAARRRSAPFVRKGHEGMTESGYLRALSLFAPQEVIDRLDGRLKEKGTDPSLWHRAAADRLFFDLSLLGEIDPAVGMVAVDYWEASLKERLSYRHPFAEVPLNRNRKVAIERRRVVEGIPLEGEALADLGRLLVYAEGAPLPSSDGPLKSLLPYEFTSPGFQDYL